MMTLRGQDHAARADPVISNDNLRHRFSCHAQANHKLRQLAHRWPRYPAQVRTIARLLSSELPDRQAHTQDISALLKLSSLNFRELQRHQASEGLTSAAQPNPASLASELTFA